MLSAHSAFSLHAPTGGMPTRAWAWHPTRDLPYRLWPAISGNIMPILSPSPPRSQLMTLIDNYLDGPDAAGRRGRDVPGATNRPSHPRQMVHAGGHLPSGRLRDRRADRIKRVIAENEPTLFGGDPDLFAARLAYHQRSAEEELLLIETIRKQVARILRTLVPGDFQRRGIHSESGPLTLEALVQRITGHIPHHVRFIEEKRKAMTRP